MLISVGAICVLVFRVVASTCCVSRASAASARNRQMSTLLVLVHTLRGLS
jgi:hypothetical protein